MCMASEVDEALHNRDVLAAAGIAKFSSNAPSESDGLILLTLLPSNPLSLSLPSGLITFSGRWVCFVGRGGRGGRQPGTLAN